jgi:FkbM family methyltransferase
MPDIPHVIARGKRLIKQIAGKDVWATREIDAPYVRLGSAYGGWVVCTSAGLGRTSTVYSVGVGEDISFDLALIEMFGCEVTAFDPTPRSIAWLATQGVPAKLKFHPWGLAGSDGFLTFGAPENPRHVSYTTLKSDGPTARCEVYRLSTLMQRLNDERLDLLKMDIEGSEYDVISDIEKTKIRPRQLMVEFHHDMYGITVARTRSALSGLRRMGYRIFSISPSGREYSLLLRP